MREVLSSTDQPALEEHFEREERNRRHEFGREIRRQGIKKTRKKHFKSEKHMVHLFKDSVHTVFHSDFTVGSMNLSYILDRSFKSGFPFFLIIWLK